MSRFRVFIGLWIILLVASACNLGSSAEVTNTRPPTQTGSRTVTGTSTITATVRVPTQLPLPTTRGTVVSQLPTAAFPTARPPFGTVIPPLGQVTATPAPTRIAILSPGPGSVISGNVQITGAALHPRFLQYQLEYGPDPNPGNLWYPADSVRFTPVLDNVLGSWNTAAIPDGTYTLRLRVFLRDGTTLSTVSSGIRVRNTAPTPVPSATPSVPRPIAAFSADRYSGEGPLAVRFFNQSSGSISGITWNFGDGTASSEANPTHTYTNAGLYTVTLTISGPGGTSNVASQINVRSATAPIAGFSQSTASGRSPLTVQFTDQSTGNVTSWLWNFSDGTTSSERNPSHTFTGVGTYNVFLTVTGPGGTSIARRQVVVENPVVPPPNAQFIYSPASGVAPFTVQFTNQSTGNITAYTWNFGDGSLSSETNPVHTFTYPGTFTVTLFASGPGGNSTTQANIVVAAPTPTFTFTPTSTSVPPTATWTWTPSLTSTAIPLPSLTPTNTETLVVTAIGLTNTPTDTPVPPTATFTETATNTAVPPTATFTETATAVPPTATLSETPLPPTETPIPPTPTFTETPLPLPTETPTDTPVPPTETPTETPVPPTATLTETPTETPVPPTATPTETAVPPTETPVPPTATDTPAPPSAQFSASAMPGTPLTIQFFNQSSGEVTSVSWDFGDGNSSADANPTHTYAQGGDYTVTLTVSGPGGSSSVQNPVSVQQPPTAAFSSAPTGAALTYQFMNQSTGSVASVLWDFGDGNTSTDTNPTHTYATPGDYNVTLTVTAADGITSDDEAQVVSALEPTATPQPVDAVFTFAGVEGSPLSVQFVNQSSGPVASFSWDFGDGNSSADANPVHTYAQGGDYNVTLMVTSSADGSTDSSTTVVSVAEPTSTPTVEPVEANFVASPVEGSPLTVQFTSSASGPVATYLWDFGDGNFASDVHPVHTYLSAGDYTVTLTVTAADGVTTDSATNVVTVVAPTPTTEPVDAAFAAAPVEGVPLTLQFANQSTGPVVSVAWDFGDGNTSADPNPTHTYGAAGDYNVTLTVTAADGITTDTATNPVSVIAPTPTTEPVDAVFAAAAVEGVPLTVQFTNQSTGPVISVAWDFGDGNFSNDPNPTHTYGAAGDYNVTLTVTSADGVTTDTATNPVSVAAPTPTTEPVDAAFVAAPVEGVPLTVQFTSQSTGPVASYTWDFGDGNFSNEANPQHAYGAAGDYSVTLTTTATDGVTTDVASQTVSVTAAPEPTEAAPEPLMTLNAFIGEVNDAVWNPSNTRIAAANEDGTISIWDTSTEQVANTLTGHATEVTALSWSANGGLLASGSSDGLILIWDMNTLQPIVTQQAVVSVNTLAWSSNSVLLAVGSDDGNIVLIDTAGNATPLWQTNDAVTSLAWGVSDTRLLIGAEDGSITLIDMATGQPVPGYPVQADVAVYAVAWNPNNLQFATALGDNTIVIWDVATGQPALPALDEHTDWATAVAWSPDGTELLTGSGDGTIIIWDATTGTSVQTFTGHTDVITALEWNNNGSQFLSASDDGTILVWES